MEQQTISIAKAGITTMLKSRTSVLAAANPPSGRYDDLKSAQDNIDLQSTILSRFDLIFIVKDPADPERDKMIARKVLDNHRSAGAPQGAQLTEQQKDSAKEVEFLKRYIHYCRSQCFPRLSETAQERLAAFYVEIRGEARSSAAREDTDNPPVPVTVRQLEAIIRISESFAKMSLLPTATLEHVEMAIQLFTKATMDAVKSGVTSYNIASDPQRERIHRLEDKIKRRVGVGSYITQKRLMEEMVALGESEMFVMRALLAMQGSGEIEFKRERTIIHRIR
jgi:DNA replication licensing factor MCM5